MAAIILAMLSPYLYWVGAALVAAQLLALASRTRYVDVWAAAQVAGRVGALCLLCSCFGATGQIDLMIFPAIGAIVGGAGFTAAVVPRRLLKQDGNESWERREAFGLSLLLAGLIYGSYIVKYKPPREDWVWMGAALGSVVWFAQILVIRTLAKIAESSKASNALAEGLKKLVATWLTGGLK
jgi:hypothetical protein